MRILPPHPCLCKYFNHLFCEFPYARNTKKSLILCGTDNPAAVHNDPARRGNDRRCVPCTTTRRLFVAQHNGSGCARTPPCSIIELNIFLTILVYPRRHDREIFRTDHKAAFGQSAAYAHVHRIRSDCELADVNILASGQSDVQAGTLYFADAGQLTPDTVLPTNLLYYGTLPPELADRLTNSAMIDRGEFAVLFQTVKELLSYQQSDQQLYTQVLYMLCNGAELDRVLTKMTDVTGDLFVVIDSTGKLVAKTKNFYVDYPLWMRSIEQGYCSDILMEYIEDRRRKNEYSLSDKPFTLFCEHMQRYLLCTRIVYDNFMMGYVIIVSKTGMFSAAEQQIIPLLSNSAKERIVKSNNGNWIDYRASQLNNIFADMLAGAQNVDMERRMKLAKLSFPEQKCLAIIRPVYYKEPAYYKSRLIPDMQAIFGKTAFSVVKNDLVLLLTAADGGTITPEQRAALEQYTQGHRLIVGISNCFQANNQLSLHYNMLLQTLQLAKQMRSDQKLFFFSDYVYYALLDQAEDKSLLSFIRHPALDTLIHYDREKSAELYQTLRVFTKCGFNKAHTSERLFLHRNTVNYRIAQIESICGIDLSTTELLFSLQLSFLIDGYLNNVAF